jgi:hypothetical protein
MVSAGAELYLVCSNRHSYRLWVSVMSIDPRSLLSRTSNFPTITVPSKPFQVLPHWDINPAKTMATKNRELIVPSRPFQALPGPEPRLEHWYALLQGTRGRGASSPSLRLHLPAPAECRRHRVHDRAAASATGVLAEGLELPRLRGVETNKHWAITCGNLRSYHQQECGYHGI